MKESKLGILAESKLTPTSGAIQAKPSNGSAGLSTKPPPTFSFTPLTKPVEDTKVVDAEINNTNTATKQDTEVAEKKEKGFVFGQNLTARVENSENTGDINASAVAATLDSKQESGSKPDSTSVTPPKDFSSSPSLLFGGVVTPTSGTGEVTRNITEHNDNVTEDDGATKTLSESAAEYTESHSNKRKYDVVDVVTGEEEESNVLQANVKLYLFDTEKRNWTERGRGVLRLNDDPVSTPGHLKSRVVMRTVGSLRVILNTKLWPNMICEKVRKVKMILMKYLTRLLFRQMRRMLEFLPWRKMK